MKNHQKRYLLLISSVAAIGGLLFGFDTAVISGTTPYIQPYFNLSDIGLGWTVSSLLFGCIIGVLLSGKPNDIFGRRIMLMASAFLFIVSAFGSALSVQLATFIGFRIIGGLAVGAASVVSPMYIAEISPTEKRGQMVSFNQLAIVIGILLAFISNALLVNLGENNWRWMLAVMGIPAILFLGLLFLSPESPRWLIQKVRLKEALIILEKINGPSQATLDLEAIQNSILSEKDAGTYAEVFSPKMRPILLVGIFIAVFSQITGINSIMYYAPIIFQKIGNDANSAVIQTAFVGGTNLVFTFLAILLVDKIGRKPLLIAGSAGMMLSLIGISIAFFLEKYDGYLILIFVLMFCASFSASLGPVSWVLISEIFPNKLRSKAMSVAVMSMWLANFLLILIFPAMLNWLGGASSFLIFSILCFILLLYTYFRIPETKGKSLEVLEGILIKERL
ncbi:MAG: sugar porter family MFS transporter [Bacteroidales bacterium]|nr:sugar porter family MFS transporter [Bacteroidales bacterium]